MFEVILVVAGDDDGKVHSFRHVVLAACWKAIGLPPCDPRGSNRSEPVSRSFSCICVCCLAAPGEGDARPRLKAFLAATFLFLARPRFLQVLGVRGPRSAELRDDRDDHFGIVHTALAEVGRRLNHGGRNDKAIQLDPKNRASYFNRAIVFQSQNKFEEALKDYDITIELDPNVSQSYFNKGLILIKIKNYEEAINTFTKYIELDPNNSMAFYSRGIAEYYLNRKSIACKDILHAAEMGLEPARGLYNKFCN